MALKVYKYKERSKFCTLLCKLHIHLYQLDGMSGKHLFYITTCTYYTYIYIKSCKIIIIRNENCLKLAIVMDDEMALRGALLHTDLHLS